MTARIFLYGGSTSFTPAFKKTLVVCGFRPVVKKGFLIKGRVFKKAAGEGPTDVSIFDAGRKAVLEALKKTPLRPYLVYSKKAVNKKGLAQLKKNGLAGVLSPGVTPEEAAFLVGKALFYGRLLNRKPRAAVNIPVVVRAGGKTINSNASQLSRDGMFIMTLNPLQILAGCSVEFKLASRKDLFKTGARVLYRIALNGELSIISNPIDPFKRLISHPGMAIFFTDLSEARRQVIDKFLERLV